MVNKFACQSTPDEEAYKNGSWSGERNRGGGGDSSDEETTSSSILPLPDTLDQMKSHFNATISNFCDGTDFHPQSELGLNPTEREISIARKITSANIILDDLLKTGNFLPVKETTTSVTPPGNSRSRTRTDKADVSDPSGETTSLTSSNEHFHTFSLAPFAFPNCECECSRATRTEALKAAPPPPPNVESPLPQAQPVPASPRPQTSVQPLALTPRSPARPTQRRRSTFWDKILFLCGKRPGPSYVVDAGQQTELVKLHVVHGGSHRCDEMWRERHEASSECECRDAATSPECTCQSFRNCPCELRPPCAFREIGVSADADDQPRPMSRERLANHLPPTVPCPQPIGSIKNCKRKRMDIYYFDHGNSAYYRTTDMHPSKYTDYMLERTDEYATRFWAEIFGTVSIGLSFVITFILQLYRCVFTAIIRSLLVGLIQIFSDYFLKPFLTVIFNGILQPCLILGYNVATSTKDFCVPVCEIFGLCANDVAIILKSCRVVEVNRGDCNSPSCSCPRNV